MSVTKQVIIDVKDISVAFNAKHGKDDYKSHVIDFFEGKKKRQSKEERYFWPLQEISFQGYQGEVLGIVGSNGSGKTTLCKVLTGILTPDKGKLTVDGKVSALFSLGMGHNNALSGRENV